MAVSHTQGPWWRDDEGFIAAGSGETYVTIADGDCSDLDIDEREANKRLIAAAPDMLAALERIVEVEGNGGSAIGMRHIALDAIKAAKGKA